MAPRPFTPGRSALAALAVAAAAAVAQAGPAADALKPGKVELKSGGPLAFGPDGVLYLGDPKAAAVYAVDPADAKSRPAAPVAVEKLDAALAGLLGVKPADVQVNDLAVNPVSNRVYLSVSRGKGADALPVLFRVDDGGKLTEVPLDNVRHARAELPNPVAAGNRRQEAITGMKVVKDKLYVAGLSNEEFASTLRAIPLPFGGAVKGAGIQIYHGAHGKYETAAPVRTFTPIEVNGKEEILAAYTCTPLVRIPVDELKDGAKVKGTTVAELGNRNRPLDIIIYSKDKEQFALIANSARGVMRVPLDGLDKVESIVSRVADKAGLKYDSLTELAGVEHLDKLGDRHAVLLVRGPAGLAVKSIDLP